MDLEERVARTSDEDFNNYEKLIQKLEAEVRQHIRVCINLYPSGRVVVTSPYRESTTEGGGTDITAKFIGGQFAHQGQRDPGAEGCS